MQIPAGKKIFFLSDFHLGAPDASSSLIREKEIVRFLDENKADAAAFFIVGDIFDFWYEYKRVVPKGHVRLLGKLAEISDSGIELHLFAGNHDMWMKNYFQLELNAKVYMEPAEFEFNGNHFYIGHGDGLGPGDHGYKAMKKVFRNPVCQWLFGILPTRVGIGVADYFSRKSRAATGISEETFLGENKEWLITYCRDMLSKKNIEYFVFGHRHLPIDFRLNNESRYINLGDWIRYFTYGVFDGTNFELRSFSGQDDKIIRKQ
jgi:UDP-2,3-diacylglucosamine hydrolase